MLSRDEGEPGPLAIESEGDLRRNIRRISRRLDEHPDIAPLLFVNPVLALRDVGVELSPDMRRHVMDALRFPPRLRERTAALEQELGDDLRRLGVPAKLPLTPKRRADLLFRELELEPLEDDAGDPSRLDPGRTRAYARADPLVGKLAEFERLRQGSLVFQPRAVYEAYKRGDRQHRWVRSVRFNV